MPYLCGLWRFANAYMNVKQSSADNVWKLICHLIFPKILKYSRKNRYTVYYSITIFYKNYNF